MSLEAAAAKTATSDGTAPVSRRVADPEVVAARRLQASADRYYEPEIDIDWDAPAQGGKRWLPEHQRSFVGTRFWGRLNDEQRLELDRQQVGNLCHVVILFESGLGVFLYRILMDTGISDSKARYVLTELGEETRHSTMFARLAQKLNESGPPLQVMMPKGQRGMVPIFTSFAPVGPALYAAILMAEEGFDRLQREWMNDPDVQPHVRAAARIHVIEEARHMAFAKEEIARGMQESGWLARFQVRMTLAGCALLFPGVALVNPWLYRSVGVHPLKGALQGFFAKRYGENARILYGTIARYLYENDLLEGFLPRLVWRLSRALPEDLKARMRADKARARAERRVPVGV